MERKEEHGTTREKHPKKYVMGLRARLLSMFLPAMIIPLVIIAIVSWNEIGTLGNSLKEIAVADSSDALNDSAVGNIERMSTDTAGRVAKFLYERDDDILYLASLAPTEESYRNFSDNKLGRLVKKGTWVLADDGMSWVEVKPDNREQQGGVSTNRENNDMDGFHYRQPEDFMYENIPLYDEITYIDLNGQETVKYVSPRSTKKNYPMNPEKRNVSQRENTYVKAETYFSELQELAPGEIYVSDVTGAYVGSNYIGMYTPNIVEKAAAERGYEIPYDAEAQAYAGKENPNGQRFEGIVRWATPVTDSTGNITGYVSFALNHDHILEFVDHISPMEERYVDLPSAYEGNYAFIWDYKCRNICHPRHNSIVGFDPETGDPQIPWLETTIYESWQESDVEKWTDFVADYPLFYQQSRDKKPAAALTKAGLVGLDGRYLNNAPQCTGWMDLTKEGGSGSFYILWSGLYKLNTAAAIPYYTGHYAPSRENGYSKRGFGFVAIGAGLDDFTNPAVETEEKLEVAVKENLGEAAKMLGTTTMFITGLLVMIAILLSSFLTKNISKLVAGVARFSAGERQFRFHAPVKDEFGVLADSFDAMADNIAESATGPCTIIDRELKILYMNEHGLEICQKPLDQVVGTPYGETSIYPTKTKYCPITALNEGIDTEVYYVEATNRYIKGIARHFLGREGEHLGYIIETIDVTEIEAAKKNAEQASVAKSNFLANMSHEIRTPMNAISGLSEIIVREGGNSQAAQYALGIRNASNSLLTIINDILDVSKIESGKLEVENRAYNLSSVINDVISISKVRLGDKPLIFTANVDSRLPGTMIGDEIRIKQILINFLNNAIKFTDAGVIALNVFGEVSENQVQLHLSVSDTGHGIEDEDLERLFAEFERINTTKNRNIEGAGLGLAISKRLCEMMGGVIRVESQVGVGSTFTAIIPQSFTAFVPVITMPQPRTILLYETREPYISSLSDTLRDLGCTVTVCQNQSELYESMIANTYDFIFTAALYLEKVRTLVRRQGVATEIVSLANFGISTVDASVFTLAMPVTCLEIARILNGELELYEYGRRQDSVLHFTAPEAKILLVDDNMVNLQVASGLMKHYEFEIDTAIHGREALEKVQKNTYDLVFMDHMMPIMDGIDATIAIRGLEGDYYKNLPIIALTANAIVGTREMFIREGMNDFLAKPIEVQKLANILVKWLPEAKVIKTQENELKLDAKEGSESDTIQIFGVDTSRGIRSVGGTKEAYIDILSVYYTDGIQKCISLEEHRKNKDILAFKTEVHAVKSTSATIGAMEISTMAAELEKAASKEDTAYIDVNITPFLLMFQELLGRIKPFVKMTEAQEQKELEKQSNPGDIFYLKEQLQSLTEAAELVNISSIETIVAALNQFSWPEEIGKVLKEIKMQADNFDYDGVVEQVVVLKEKL